MEGDGGSSTVCVPVLSMGPALPHLNESEALQQGGHFSWLQDRKRSHLRNLDGVHPDELGQELRLSVFEQHADDFLEVALQVVKTHTLTVGAGPPWNVADVEACLRVALNDDGIAAHWHRLAARIRQGP